MSFKTKYKVGDIIHVRHVVTAVDADDGKTQNYKLSPVIAEGTICSFWADVSLLDALDESTPPKIRRERLEQHLKTAQEEEQRIKKQLEELDDDYQIRS